MDDVQVEIILLANFTPGEIHQRGYPGDGNDIEFDTARIGNSLLNTEITDEINNSGTLKTIIMMEVDRVLSEEAEQVEIDRGDHEYHLRRTG